MDSDTWPGFRGDLALPTKASQSVWQGHSSLPLM